MVSQFVIFEFKFSVILFYFHKSDGEQDRYHTHAFNAISFKIFGTYDEKKGKYHIENRKDIIKYFPRNRYHKIGKSTGCLTLLFSGPWNKEWKEYCETTKKITYYIFGRKVRL